MVIKIGAVHGAWRRVVGTAAALAVVALSSAPASAAGEAPKIERQAWSFAGIFGHYDRGQLQRGFKIYKEVCSSCHSMNLMKYRNLGEPGGPEFTKDEVKAIAASIEFPAPTEDDADATRKGKPFDRFKAPYASEAEARAAQNGALPPDLSVIAKARGVHAGVAWYLEPLEWVKDIVTGYQEGGPDYIYALLTGYRDEPPAYVRKGKKLVRIEDSEAGADALRCASVEKGKIDEKTKELKPDSCVKLQDGMNYSAAFPGHQIAMAAPLDDDLVEFSDGTKPTKEQLARDISAFLMWAAEPKLEVRKQVGLRVILYLLILAVLLYLTKRMVWSRLKH